MWLFRTRLKGAFLFLACLLCFVLVARDSQGHTSVDIPVGSSLYDDFERLQLMGLIDSAMLATKPFDRLEGARLTDEALGNIWRLKADRAAEAQAILERLQREFREELGPPVGDWARLKPVQSLYIKTFWAGWQPYFVDVNNHGDEVRKGFNQRAGFVLTASLFDMLSFYLNPEFRADGGSTRGRIVRGYAKLDIAGVTLQIGRDSMWWGSAAHGGLLMTDNAAPLDMLKLTPTRPFLLPWVSGLTGPLKPTLFLARLEKDRDFPRANLLGMRLDFRPTPHFQFGLNRVFLFGGEGRKSLSASDWVKVFTASDSAEHMASPINGDQIVSVDASYVYVNKARYVPVSSVKLYLEIGAEDSSGHTRSPTTKAYLFGFLAAEPFRIKGVDLRAEYATTARGDRLPYAQWYRHPIYTTGYTFEGRVIGHHMGPDAKDLFLRLQYRHPSGLTLGAEADFEKSDVHTAEMSKRSWFAADMRYPTASGLTVSGTLGVEETDDPSAGGLQRGPNLVLDIEKNF